MIWTRLRRAGVMGLAVLATAASPTLAHDPRQPERRDASRSNEPPPARRDNEQAREQARERDRERAREREPIPYREPDRSQGRYEPPRGYSPYGGPPPAYRPDPYAARRSGAGDNGYGPPPAARDYPPSRAYPNPYPSSRRGRILPSNQGAEPVINPGQHHLRPAPRGYHWVNSGRDFLLVQDSSGLVVDQAERDYPPPY